jgi:O-antigen ligase
MGCVQVTAETANRPLLNSATDRLNWPLLILIFLLPLQNIYLGKIPSLGSGFNILNILLLIAFASAMRNHETSFANPINKFILFMMLNYILSAFVATLSMGWNERSTVVLKDIFFAYLIFFVTYKSISGTRSITALLWATILPLPYMFKVFYTNLSWMGFSTYQDKLRLNSGTFMELGSNEIAAFYATYTFILLAFALLQEDRKKKWFMYLCIASSVYCLMYGFSRGAYLAGMMGLVVFCWFFGSFKKLVLVVVVVLTLLTFGADIFPKAVTERFNSTFVEEEERDDSAQSRFVLWEIAMDKFQRSPIVGVGFNNFKKMNEYGKDTHNYYVKMLAECGLVGFVALVAFLIASFRNGLALFQRSSENKFNRLLAVGFLSCLTAIIFGNLFGDRFTHYPLISYFYVYLAIIVKSLELIKETKSSDASPSAY